MTGIERQPAILLLQDGTVFHGKAAGATGTATGEVCFNTGMTGYQEIFTDPSYFGQIMVTTNAHIGNYGVKDTDVESDSMKISGLVCKNFTNDFSRPIAGVTAIQDYFKAAGMVAISDVDTRALVRHIREKGAMNAIISSETFDIEVLKEKLAEAPDMAGLELSSKVSTKTAYTYGNEDSSFRIAALDFGVDRRRISRYPPMHKVIERHGVLYDLQAIKNDVGVRVRQRSAAIYIDMYIYGCTGCDYVQLRPDEVPRIRNDMMVEVSA